MEKYQDELLKNKDKRMEIINEVLQVSIPLTTFFLHKLFLTRTSTSQSIRIIKYFAWEKNFAKKINHIRGIEVKYLMVDDLVTELTFSVS